MKTQSESVALHYDELDPFYRSLWGEHLHHGLWLTGHESVEEAVKNLIHRVANLASISQHSQVCDIGCGYGGTAHYLSHHFNIPVTGITLSRQQYTYACSKASSLETYILGNWLENTLPSSSYDVALSIESSEHMEDKELFCKEAFRILQPGGRLVICAWLTKEHLKPWEINYFLKGIEEEGRLTLNTVENMTHLLTQAGFEHIKFENLSSQVSKTWSICMTRVLKAFFTDSAIRKFLMNQHAQNRAFIKSVFRIRLAYALGIMQYGIFSAKKQ